MPKVFLLSDQPVLLVGFEYVLRQHDFDVVGRCQTAEFPVVYYVDPRFGLDDDTKTIKEITLSYTFFPAPGAKRAG